MSVISRTSGGSYIPSADISDVDALHAASSTAIDSVSVAEPIAENWSPERPHLTSPGDLPPPRLPLSDWRLLAATDESRNLGDEIMRSLGTRISGIKDKIREISTDNMAKLREAAERASTSNFWSVLKKIATCLLSAVSIVFGIAIVGSGAGAVVGGAMIASGILSLANFALSEMGAWNWVADQIAHDNEELKGKISFYLPAAVGIVAGGIGLVGAVGGIALGAVQLGEKIVFVMQATLSIFDGVTTMGKGIADARQLWTKADLTVIQSRLTVERQNFSSVIEEIKGSMNDFKAVKAKTKKAIETIVQSNIQLVR